MTQEKRILDALQRRQLRHRAIHLLPDLRQSGHLGKDVPRNVPARINLEHDFAQRWQGGDVAVQQEAVCAEDAAEPVDELLIVMVEDVRLAVQPESERLQLGAGAQARGRELLCVFRGIQAVDDKYGWSAVRRETRTQKAPERVLIVNREFETEYLRAGFFKKCWNYSAVAVAGQLKDDVREPGQGPGVTELVEQRCRCSGTKTAIQPRPNNRSVLEE